MEGKDVMHSYVVMRGDTVLCEGTEVRALLQQAMEMAGMVPAAGQAEPEAAPAPAS